MTFAYIYDQLMSDIDYQLIFDFIEPYISDKHIIIDAGCGTGYLTEKIARKHQVIGLDIDSDMLTIARNRLVSNGHEPLLYEHDIRDEIPLQVDAIVSMFDVINFNEDVTSIFKSFYQALSNDGLCIIDIYKEEVLEVYQNYHESDASNIAYTWDVSVMGDRLKHRLEVDEQIFEITQFVKPLSFYTNILKDIGFTCEVVDGPDERKHYMILKK